LDSLLAIRRDGAENSSIFKVSKRGEISLYYPNSGRICESKSKLSSDPDERYLAIQLSYSQIAIFTQGEPLSTQKPIKITLAPNEFGGLLGLRLIEGNKLIVLSKTGNVSVYQIKNRLQVKLLKQAKFDLLENEGVCTFDVFLSGEVVCISTFRKGLNSCCRLISMLLSFDKSRSIETIYDYNFELKPEIYHQPKEGSRIVRLHINFMCNGRPIIFAFQEGASLNMGIYEINKEGFRQIAFNKKISYGEYADSEVGQDQILVFDNLANLLVLKLPVKG